MPTRNTKLGRTNQVNYVCVCQYLTNIDPEVLCESSLIYNWNVQAAIVILQARLMQGCKWLMSLKGTIDRVGQ